ncbi:hypothetical protein BC830DRAFT_1130844 [Chytriomyces sp. MP71]|nr:hypothetical protein BC830DRAFT_1130844 [Chytriomyces sp. MP71]
MTPPPKFRPIPISTYRQTELMTLRGPLPDTFHPFPHPLANNRNPQFVSPLYSSQLCLMKNSSVSFQTLPNHSE